MTTRNLLSVFLILSAMVITGGCEKEDLDLIPTPPSTGRLKAVWHGFRDEPPTTLSEEYRYDTQGRISIVLERAPALGAPIEECSQYHEYFYNDAGQLAKIETYKIENGKPRLSYTKAYYYFPDGKLEKDTWAFNQGDLTYNLYSYKSGLLHEKVSYDEHDTVTGKEVYHHNSVGQIVLTEGSYLPWSQTWKEEHTYKGGLKVRKILLYISSPVMTTTDVQTEYTYDHENNLITERGGRSPSSSNTVTKSSVEQYNLRYEYF